MIFDNNIDDLDRRIMQLRALGYHQNIIASQLGISQSAVSQRIEKIRQITEGTNKEDAEKLFWTLLLGAGAIYLIGKALEKK
jgi:hypothetical protein